MKKGTTKSASPEAHVQSNSSRKSGKTGGKLLIILIVLLISVIGVLGAVVYSLLTKDDNNGGNGSSNPGRDTVVTLDNKDQILADLNDQKVSDGLFEIKMNMEWSFQDASTPSENAYVANVTKNSNTVYFTVTLDKTGETVYESPFIPVGYALKDITLKKELAAGTYPCTLTYHLVDENNEDVSNLAVTVTLKVLN